jgi:hypothetical protein
VRSLRRVLPADQSGLLSAIRDALDIPVYVEGDESARDAYLDLLQVRHADVMFALNEVLAVGRATAAGHARQLRRFTAETPVDYPVDPARGGGL